MKNFSKKKNEILSFNSNPRTWKPEELIEWMTNFEKGRFECFIPQLHKELGGDGLYKYSDSDWLQLEPQELATTLRFIFMGMCAVALTKSSSMKGSLVKVPPTSLKELQKDNPSLVTPFQEIRSSDISCSSTKPSTIPASFPPIIEMPAIWHILLAICLIVAYVLCATVFKDTIQEKYDTTPIEILQIASIPLICIAFTYLHIWLALFMTFYPLKYYGCLRIPGTNVGLGWEGIIPFKGEKMARTSVRIMTSQLMDVKEVFSKVEPRRVVEELQDILYGNIRDIVESMALKYNPKLWNMLPESVKKEIIEKVKEESPTHIESLMTEIRDKIENVFDIEDMVVRNMMRDKQLLVNMFLTCGYDELAFIRNSGAYMGGIFGLLQMCLWIYYQERIVVFALFGLLLGTLTNWLALKMIFEPVNPTKFLCFTLQGLFLRRQHQVAAEYGRMVASDVLNSRNIIEAILKGPASDKLFELVYLNVRQAVDAGASITEKIVQIGIGKETYDHIKEDVVELIVDKFPDSLRHIESYTQTALDLEVTLRDKLRAISPSEFEGLLHPVFQEDEWKLIVMGGVLGLLIGLFQAYCLNIEG